MKTFIKRLRGQPLAAILSTAIFLALIAGVVSAIAQTSRTFSPRLFLSQQTHYIRIDAKFNAINGVPCTRASIGGSATTFGCIVRVGAVPYNSYLVRAYQQIITNFNAGTADTLGIGTGSTAGTTAVNVVAGQSVHSGAGDQTALTLVSTGSGVQVTGNSIAQTGGNGGFDIWVQYAQSGAAATAGQAVVILEYIAPNDGDCAPVPMGSTAGAC